MKREDLEKLLGGYAAGTLTAEERSALFEAALTDQALFEALADEESLRDALADPEVRAQVRAALREEPPSLFERLASGMRARRGWTFAAATAATVVLLGAIVFRTGALHKTAPEKQELAVLRTPPPPEELAAPAPLAKNLDRASRAKEAAPRRFAPPSAVFKQKAPAPASPAVSEAPTSEGPQGAVGGVVGAAPPPPPPASEAAQVTAENKPRMLLSSVSSQAKALFYEPETGVVAKRSRDNLLDRERDSGVRDEKRAGAGSAPVPQVGDLGLRYSLMRRGPDGKDIEVPLDTALDPGEPARLRIEANQSAYLSVIADGVTVYSGPVIARMPTLVDARPGKFHVSLSRQSDVGAAGMPFSRPRAQLGAVNERADQPVPTEPADKAVYVVNTGQSADPRVVADFELKSR